MGQINITGDKITVEATFNRTTPYSGGLLYAGDLVSKHNTPSDVNYLLRPNDAEITTSNGYFRTPDICEIELNKTYHVAMVYDGATLKFYRNGFLMSQVAATGNLFQNTWKTQVGFYDPQAVNTNFIGYINEVRIWNTVKTQAEIRANMKSSLPNPTTQPGLVAYYTFDNLINKQGNTAFNGVLSGAATINGTNPNCTIVPDSCSTIVNPPGISGIINTYTPVLAFNPCDNKITVDDASTFKIGDTVLMIQMKGAIIDSSNTSSFGTITDYRNAGNYEFNYIKNISGNIIELTKLVTRQYDINMGKVQLIRVPYFNNITISSTLSCLPWDGKKGGILAFNVQDTLSLQADIDVTGKGFKGGTSPNSNLTIANCFVDLNYAAVGNPKTADKGESIYDLGDDKKWGKASVASAGGGGLDHNAGGGGGGNGGSGGKGGFEVEGCGAIFDNGGRGGKSVSYTNTSNKIFMGGGGGSGHANNVNGANMNGGSGGGIIIITSNFLKNNGHKIISNGTNGAFCDSLLYDCNDGNGGGGSGGTILLNINKYSSLTQVNAKGGKGGDLTSFNKVAFRDRLGPGGGGGGGIIWLQSLVIPANLVVDYSGGLNGVIISDNNNPYGATSGQTGLQQFGLKVPIAAIPFSNNIDSVRIKSSIISCQRIDFKGFAFTRSFPIAQWTWSFGDNSFANTQNTLHTYLNPGTYPVKLIVTDINGCVDSIVSNVTITNQVSSDFGYKQDICNPLSVQFFNIGATPLTSFWSFGDGKTTTGNLNPTNVYAAPGNFIVKYSMQSGSCSDTVTKNISVNVLNANIITTPDTTICFKSTKQLRTIPALNFCWSPSTFLDDPNSPNPTTSATQPITYYFTAELAGANLIKNGDFSLGNIDFTSQYNYAANNTTEGQYFVGSSPSAWNPNLSACPDHSGTNDMMMVNGAQLADVNVWTQTVAVTPNTNYAFSTWIQALYSPNPAQLSFSINGGTLGNLITASLPTCTWDQFYTTWNSGNNTSATIAIVNKNTFVQGNDFALDDISFSPVLIKRDSVRITIDTPFVKAGADTAICPGKSIQLSASGAVSYSWSPTTGLSNIGIANPVSTVNAATQYIVSGKNSNGCSANDTVNISMKPLPLITRSADSTICRNVPIQLFASGGTSYSWLPASTLSDPSISNPIATPTANTTYTVTVTGTNSCSRTDSVKISLRSSPVFTISPSRGTCVKDNIALSAGGGTSYLWSPANLLNNSTISDPVASINGNMTFTVRIKDSQCNDSTTLSTTISIALPPVIAAFKSNDIDCAFTSTQLTATGANSYVWSPSTGLNNSNIANPVASVNAPQQYMVTGTDTSTQCSGTATVSILVKPPFPPSFFIPTAFTPNGDGLNDCYRVRHFGTVKSVDVSIYNRLGNRVFHALNVNDCWDGTYKGTNAEPGNYVYYIKAFNDCGEITKKGNLVLVR